LVLSRIGHGAIGDARDRFVDLTAPLLEAASAPVIMGRHALARAHSYVGLAGEIDRLKAENEQLKQWEWRQVARAQCRASPLAAECRR